MELTIIAAAAVVAIVTVAAISQRIAVAAPLSMVVVGIALSFLPGLPEIQVNPEWILAGALPPLLYATAVHVPGQDFRRDFKAIAGLAVPLVVLTTVCAGLLFYAPLPVSAGPASPRPPTRHGEPARAVPALMLRAGPPNAPSCWPPAPPAGTGRVPSAAPSAPWTSWKAPSSRSRTSPIRSPKRAPERSRYSQPACTWRSDQTSARLASVSSSLPQLRSGPAAIAVSWVRQARSEHRGHDRGRRIMADGDDAVLRHQASPRLAQDTGQRGAERAALDQAAGSATKRGMSG